MQARVFIKCKHALWNTLDVNKDEAPSKMAANMTGTTLHAILLAATRELGACLAMINTCW